MVFLLEAAMAHSSSAVPPAALPSMHASFADPSVGRSLPGGFPLRAFPGSQCGAIRPRIPSFVKVLRWRQHSLRNSNSKIRCEATKVKIRLRLDHQVRFGEHHALLGSSPSMGSWKNRVPMQWTESGWVADLEVDAAEQIEFKFIIVLENGDLIWEEGSNRVLEFSKGGNFEFLSQWNDTQGSSMIENATDRSEVERESVGGRETSTNEALSMNGSILESNGSLGVIEGDTETSSNFMQEWQGRDISFMRSNAHKREQTGKWDTTGLEGSEFNLVDGDKNASNWWRKLEMVLRLITGDLFKANRLGCLINISIYLKWINTGQIQCFEDGGHHRPNKHAEISRIIFQELERNVVDNNLSIEEQIVIRKIHPSLPSFKAEFTASVPLTRIRDIAHRNDIPHDLKQEIKHTIQNKLHRNAGPEDLVATELLLSRVTKKPGEYSAAFVEQLQIFFKELKDFFNAGSLTEQLDSIRPSLDEQGISMLEDFLAQKKRLDDLERTSKDGVDGTDSLIGTMHTLTSLRACLLKGLESGLRNDASDDAIAMRQKWRLCEIGLEDYVFVLLSRFANTLDSMGGSAFLAQEAQSKKLDSWNHPLGAVVLGIRHLGLSGFQQQECMAIENEIIAWQSAGITKNEGNEDGVRIWALRLKATIERARRLSETYSDLLLQIYPQNVEKLGNAFGIPENTIKCYTEAEIRASVVFQLSKLCSLILKGARAVVGEEGWDPLVLGQAIGTLVEAERIIPESLSSISGPIILLVQQADGDEEVKASGENVQGVILLQELPHLSHLGVRARQEKVVFVTCEDEDKIAHLRSLVGSTIKLEASTNAVVVSPYKTEDHEAGDDGATGMKALADEKTPSSNNVEQGKAVKIFNGHALDLSKAEIATCGSKAHSCAQLALLSLQSKPAFYVPMGKAIPFGAMEAALRSSGDDARFNELLAKAEHAKLKDGDLDKICEELQSVVAAQRLPKTVVDEICKSMLPNARLIVRSSANVEDLAGMSGAGLYESIPNVRASDVEGFTKAVAQVWASLYTRRAVLSRRFAGVAQKEATMAVLVQELLSPQLSFVLHTVSPVDQNKNVVAAEIASGLGETLAAGTRGTPWRLSVNKFDGSVKTFTFANFSEELVVDKEGIASRGTTSVVDPYVLSSYFKKVVDKEYSIANENLCSMGLSDDDLSEAAALAKAEAEASNKVHKILLKSLSGGGSGAHSAGDISVASAVEAREDDETEIAIDAGNEELDALEITDGDSDGGACAQTSQERAEPAI